MSVLTLQVDEVMRTLSNDGQYPFVVNDKTVDIVRFALNTGFTDVVLDEYSALRVMYQRPGETEVRAQTLTYYDTDGLRNYYDWQLLSADLTEKGTLTVALCILRTDSEVEEWHTTPCQIRVLDTIHTDDSDEGDETITPTVAQRVAVLETVIQRVASGAPIVVSSASAMTDTDQIYVLSTNGEWYYYDGSAWVAGGEYGAVATDTTLTQANVPADAKVVGDAVESMSDRMDTALSGNVDFIEYDGYYNKTGEIIGASEIQKEKYTNKIDVEAYHNIEFTLTYPEEMYMWAAYCTFDADGNFISRDVFRPSKDASSAYCKPEVTSNAKFVSFTYRSYDVATVVITADYNFVKLIDDAINTNVSKIRINYKLPTRACYDHLFVRNEGTRITIPHESLYHVRASRLFGFNCIEANVSSTSDGVFIVNHLIGNKFERFFVHADGVTDISEIDVSTVTWDWIAENVRYKTSIPQYRTRPCRLEEFLGECRQQEIIPFITSSDAAAVALANQYMGKGNFIAYNGDRDKCPTEVIYRWMSEPTKEDILAKCELYGKPFIYGMSNVKNFSDSELKDIVKAVHEAGYWIGVSYVDENWHKYADLGFDVNGTQARINRIENGNICNLDSLFNFDDFIYTNAAETNGTLVFSADGTISPKISNDAFSMCAFDVEISFVGTITIPAIGEGKGAHTYSSDGSYPFFVAIPIINGSPKVTITVNNGTIINDMKYKASKF